MGCGCSSAKIAAELSDTPEKEPKPELNKNRRKQQNSIGKSENVQTFGINLPINAQNIFCFTIGDIENQDQKLEKIISFMKLNPSKQYVFLGDLFDDISWPSDSRKNGIRCIQLLDEAGFFRHQKDLEILDDFRDIQFKPATFESIQNNIKFIVGNSECDVLNDIVTNLTNNQQPDQNDFYTFGKGKYQKKFTFNQLSLLYKYFLNCHSAISYKINNTKTLWFRHAARTFKRNYSFIDQCSDITPTDNTPIVCGHNHGFGVVEKNIFMNDTCLNQNDYRIGIIEIDGDGNVEAQAIHIDFEYPEIEFPKPPQKQ